MLPDSGNNQPPLLSSKASQQLGLVTLHMGESVTNISKTTQSSMEPLTRERILTEYKDVFNGPGCLAGELHLEVDKSVTPACEPCESTREACEPFLRAMRVI